MVWLCNISGGSDDSFFSLFTVVAFVISILLDWVVQEKKVAANRGNSIAQKNMGISYYYGENGDEDAKKQWNELKLWKYE